jgi:hypothetical protein
VDLIEELASFSSDPLGFVLFAFPWGEEETELAEFSGPDDWQIKVLEDLGAGLITVDEAIQIARTSGHGIGKSALVAWIILWAISTFEDTKGVVTANTENQLKTKTWAEVSKWHRMFIARDLFKMTATALFANDPLHERTGELIWCPGASVIPKLSPDSITKASVFSLCSMRVPRSPILFGRLRKAR